eukprot:CAMPEP_0118692106 /NCGR_PEP_ID=MMETSP0800-20121206/11072_1 /TAXON_ID=210618 ORGANISM="Striatella unipunctata, Strain CCMP2910" /NCGR_SAMPLE_ID=MMETSP0800 /ASSEMBLY_ACC=CAM_ASM_000638 /LENGTH=441 /DNA_ID=CAMNT_0006590001 /DNA_START=261 /DNA_END=1586 /DNA_ORIENTATION=+
MAVASTMSQSRRPPGPPPGPPPSRTNARPPPPPPPRAPGRGRPTEFVGRSGLPGGKKRSSDETSHNNPRKKMSVSIMAPVVLRDVTAFEKKQQVGQGTYGSVFMGADKQSGEIVALKRINTEQEENGFPLTALREVKILKALNHVNIVELKEIVTSKEQGDLPKNVFMVFEYLEFDLTGILETPEIRLTQDHIKSWSQQLLCGVHYMHKNKVIHRDLKASNILVNKRGELKIADWGLARSWNSEMKRLTNRVITLWYRPPELLLGCIEYTPKIDMWSVGCIIAELFRRSGFLKGSNEATQLDLIFKVCGHPTVKEWPNIHKQCRLWKNYEPGPGETALPRRIREVIKSQLPHPAWMTEHAKTLIDKLMILNPDDRWSAEKALDAEYFFENPIVKPAHKLSMRFAVDSVHEWDARKRHEQMVAQHQTAMASKNPRTALNSSR